MNINLILFIIVTVIVFMAVFICIKLLKRHGTWYDFKSSFVTSIIDKVPLIVGIAIGIFVSLMMECR